RGGGEGFDQGKLLGKLQESVSPDDIGRFMEIFSDFIATPEGRAFQKRLESFMGRVQLPFGPRGDQPRQRAERPAKKAEKQHDAPGARPERKKTEHGVAQLY